jgi:hypothetical protein
MFVFWYCHKRGREVRLAREAEEGQGDDENEDALDVEVSDEEDERVAQEVEELEKEIEEKANVLDQPDPTRVPLPDHDQGEKAAEEETEKTAEA